ncbi:MAG: MATE family efflux transporter [Phycisphaerae bacterium]|nr:MATE family efflux transporter [Phycisphaerae bacterium]
MTNSPVQPVRAERSPLLEMLMVALPIVATMTSYTAMQFVDGLMVSRIGPDPVYVAAQGNGGVAAFVPVAVMMGLMTVVNTFVSQNLGAGRPERGAAYAWTGLWLALGAFLVFMMPYGLGLRVMFESLADHSTRLTELEVAYGRILVYGSLLTMGTRCLSQYFFGMHRPVTVLVAALAGNATNVVLNALLIYGPTAPQPVGIGVIDGALTGIAGFAAWAGVPALGVEGAALATVIGTGVELSIPLLVFLSPGFNRLYRTRAAWRFSGAHARDIARLGWPGALMFGNELLCWAYLMAVLIGHFGELHNTAGWIALRYMHLAFMPAIGLSTAVTAQVGKCMGMGRPDLAARRAWLGLSITMSYMGLCAVGFVMFRARAIGLFVDPAMDPERARELIEIGSRVMIAAAVFQIFDALGLTMIGALRGAGDTVWPGVATLVLAWSCLIGLGTAVIRVAPQWESIGPWSAAAAYIILLGLAVLGRFLGGRWKSMRVVDTRAEGVASAGSAGQ